MDNKKTFAYNNNGVKVFMPVKYHILPEVDLVLYICTDTITTFEFFKVAELAGLDPCYRSGMKIIIDFFSADLETSISDLRLAIAENNRAIQRGQVLGQTAVITKSSSLKFLGDALKLMSDSFPTIRIFNTRKDAIKWMNLNASDLSAHWAIDAEEIAKENPLE